MIPARNSVRRGEFRSYSLEDERTSLTKAKTKDELSTRNAKERDCIWSNCGSKKL